MTLLRSIQTKLDRFEIKIQTLEQTMTNEIRNKTCTATEKLEISNLATLSDLKNLSAKVDRYRDQIQNCNAKIMDRKCDSHFNSTQPVDIPPNSVKYIVLILLCLYLIYSDF
jgi:hypothetical protein